MIISASSLTRCGYQRILKKLRIPSASAKKAMAKGTVFHAAIEKYIKLGQAEHVPDEEIVQWLDALLAQWTPQPNTHVEVALGLRPGGAYAPVLEPEPHVYTAEDGGELLTAGRADVVTITPEGHVMVLDWKTGRTQPEEPNTNLQLWALGIAAGERWQAKGIYVGLYMAQQGRFMWSEPVERRSWAWLQRYADVEGAATIGDRVVATPENCRACWERKNCPHDATKAAA